MVRALSVNSFNCPDHNLILKFRMDEAFIEVHHGFRVQELACSMIPLTGGGGGRKVQDKTIKY